MDILGRFQVNWISFSAQLFNFLVIALILWRFMIRPLMATMKTRREAIAQGLADAEKARQALEEAGAERTKILQAASAEAFRLLEIAREEAERLRAASLERAARDAERVVADARGTIALERQAMERDVQGLSLQLSGRILEKAMEGLFTDDEMARVVTRGMERMSVAAGDNRAGGG